MSTAISTIRGQHESAVPAAEKKEGKNMKGKKLTRAEIEAQVYYELYNYNMER